MTITLAKEESDYVLEVLDSARAKALKIADKCHSRTVERARRMEIQIADAVIRKLEAVPESGGAA